MKDGKKTQRNRPATRKEILDALGRLLSRSGFKEIGINAIAREAGVDKVLIYRYFGGMPELLRAFAEESDFWPGLPELLAEVKGSAGVAATPEQAASILFAFGRALRKRPLTQEIMRWELQERNELTDTLARYREEQGEKLLKPLEEMQGGVDVRAVASLLAAGMTYLILRSRNAEVYNGLQLNSEKEWERIEAAGKTILKALFAAGLNPPPADKPLRNRPKGKRGEARD